MVSARRMVIFLCRNQFVISLRLSGGLAWLLVHDRVHGDWHKSYALDLKPLMPGAVLLSAGGEGGDVRLNVLHMNKTVSLEGLDLDSLSLDTGRKWRFTHFVKMWMAHC